MIESDLDNSALFDLLSPCAGESAAADLAAATSCPPAATVTPHDQPRVGSRLTGSASTPGSGAGQAHLQERS